MSFLDKLKSAAGVAAQTAAGAADTAVKQTKTLASIGRVKLAIAGEEDKLKKAYTELGRLFYRDYEAQAEADMEEYLPWCGKASDARAQIQQLTEELEKIKAESEPTPEAEPEAETEAEDPAIFVDFTETEETAEEPEEAAAEPAEEPAPEPEAPAEEAPAAPAEEVPTEPTVGTLYVDISGQE